MSEHEWRKWYEEQRPLYRYSTEPMPSFEEFKRRQLEFIQQMANQPISPTGYGG